MIIYPATRETVNAELDLQRRGFCRSCGREAEWHTAASGRWVLLSVVKDQPVGAPTLLELHNDVCPQGAAWKDAGKVEKVIHETPIKFQKYKYPETVCGGVTVDAVDPGVPGLLIVPSINFRKAANIRRSCKIIHLNTKGHVGPYNSILDAIRRAKESVAIYDWAKFKTQEGFDGWKKKNPKLNEQIKKILCVERDGLVGQKSSAQILPIIGESTSQ